jgi:hypothetical protein
MGMVVMPLFFQVYHKMHFFGDVFDVASFVYIFQLGSILDVEIHIPEVSELFTRLALVTSV